MRVPWPTSAHGFAVSSHDDEGRSVHRARIHEGDAFVEYFEPMQLDHPLVGRRSVGNELVERALLDERDRRGRRRTWIQLIRCGMSRLTKGDWVKS